MLCIGGMGDGWTRQMARMAELLASLSPGLAVHYLGHWQWRRAARLVAGNGPPLILVGHSWGADRAVRLALDRPGRVARLVTCDPVGWMPVSGLRRLRASVPEWINVQASGGGPWETSNIVARIGRPYGAAACRLAHLGLVAPVPHRDLAAMLEAQGPDGRTVLERLIAAPIISTHTS